MNGVFKQIRLEKHGAEGDCHRYYILRIEHLGNGLFRVRAEYGRAKGYGRKSTSCIETKDVSNSIVNALTVFHDWRIAKEKKGYKEVPELTI